jgi:polyphosphate kinase
MEIVDSYIFRISRDSDLELDDHDEVEDLVTAIERSIRERRRGAATRLEIEATAPRDLIDYLTDALDLHPNDVYTAPGPLDLRGLMELYDLKGYERLRYPEFVPRIDPVITRSRTLFQAIREGDILLHHPYDSFKPVVDFINAAADDPQVLAVKQTLYRTSSDSPIIRALQRAADRGKQVTALVELQARLDEEKNLAWARLLERAGVHVVYGFVGLKTHCKVALVVRRDEDGIRRYVHLATGNYNPSTARSYTDLGIFTCRDDFSEDVSALFNYLTGYSELPVWKQLVVAPSRLIGFLKEKIAREAELGPGGRIVAKLNALLEPSVIQALYEASRRGVRIDLLCRGICALRPGIPGLSETIQVRSVVDRFLEHSRIYCFGNNGDPEVFISSADWMDRNLLRRIEVLFPIVDPGIRRHVIDILRVVLADNVKARRLNPDGTWTRITPGPDEPRLRSQQYFLDMALAEEGRLQLDPPLASMPPLFATAPPPDAKRRRPRKSGSADDTSAAEASAGRDEAGARAGAALTSEAAAPASRNEPPGSSSAGPLADPSAAIETEGAGRRTRASSAESPRPVVRRGSRPRRAKANDASVADEADAAAPLGPEEDLAGPGLFDEVPPGATWDEPFARTPTSETSSGARPPRGKGSRRSRSADN